MSLRENEKSEKSGKSSKTSLASISSNFANVVDLNEIKHILKNGKDTEYLLQTLETRLQESNPVTPRKCHQSVVNLPTFIKENEKVFSLFILKYTFKLSDSRSLLKY